MEMKLKKMMMIKFKIKVNIKKPSKLIGQIKIAKMVNQIQDSKGGIAIL